MPHRRTLKAGTLTARYNALWRAKLRLEGRIQGEHSRPAPDSQRLSRLKRLRLRAKDEITFIQSVLNTVDRGQRSPMRLS